MLPRIGSALTKFIQPISSSELRIEQEKFTQQQKEKKEEEKAAEIVKKLMTPTEVPQPKAALEQSENPNVESKLHLTHTFLNLFNLIQIKKGTFLKWLGEHTYQMSSFVQKKGVKCKKGTMYDQKVE